MHKKRSSAKDEKAAADNGLLDRRSLLGGTTSSLVALMASPAAAKKEIELEPWMEDPGSPLVGYGQPSKFETKVVRVDHPKRSPFRAPSQWHS
jgi:hypothetical protein